MTTSFKALMVTRDEATKEQKVETVTLSPDDLMEGDVLVRVAWSTINYKDGVSLTGKLPIIRRYPMIPGIDFSGTVETSTHPDFKPGDEVIINGWGLGETHYGAYAEMARVPGDWLQPLPEGITLRDAMAIGTAGYTAQLAVMALERHGIAPKDGPILVTGAVGGVGSVSVAILNKLGFTVIASTGRTSEAEYLKKLGAAEIIDRKELSEPGKPLGRERWVGAIDSVGSHTLANALAMTRARGAVAACGNAGGMDLPATVAPFILRGVTLYGIESVRQPKSVRIAAWNRLARDLDLDALAAMTREIGFDEILPAARQIAEGKIRGRLLVRIGG
jgi:acrylyl-CoA reductase (NADPH)